MAFWASTPHLVDELLARSADAIAAITLMTTATVRIIPARA